MWSWTSVLAGAAICLTVQLIILTAWAALFWKNRSINRNHDGNKMPAKETQCRCSM